MAVIDRGLERIARFLGGAGILVALLMALHIVIDVAARFLFKALRSIDTLEAVQTSGYFVYVFPARWFIPVGLTAMGCCALAQGIGSFRQLLRGEVEADS
jgi:hypothetical protein